MTLNPSSETGLVSKLGTVVGYDSRARSFCGGNVPDLCWFGVSWHTDLFQQSSSNQISTSSSSLSLSLLKSEPQSSSVPSPTGLGMHSSFVVVYSFLLFWSNCCCLAELLYLNCQQCHSCWADYITIGSDYTVLLLVCSERSSNNGDVFQLGFRRGEAIQMFCQNSPPPFLLVLSFFKRWHS